MTPQENTPLLLAAKLQIGRLIARQLFSDDPRLTADEIRPSVTRRLLEYDLSEAEAKTADIETINRMVDDIVAGVKADIALAKRQQAEEPSSGDWMWDEIRQHLPPHMQNDPEVAKDIGILLGMGMGTTVVAVLGFLNHAFFGGPDK